MSRFSNLEYTGRKRDEDPDGLDGAESRDEKFYLKRAEELYRTGRFEKALRFFSRALEFNPNLESGWIGQVRMLVELGEYNEALVWSDKALEIFRDHPELLAVKALAHVRLGDAQKGLEFSDAAMKSKGAGPHAWLVRAEVLLASGRRNEAYCLQKARSADTADWFLELLIARVYHFYKQNAKALTCAKKAVEGRSDSPFVWYVIGECQFASGLEDPARASYEQALSLDPEFGQAQGALNFMNGRSIVDRFRGRLRRLFGKE